MSTPNPTDPLDAAMAVTDAFLATFNGRDPSGHAATLAYPHVRLASGTVRIWDGPEEAVRDVGNALRLLAERVQWDHSVWDHRQPIHVRDNKVHLDVQFTRYRADDSVIGVYPAVYVIVRGSDGWGIQCRSSFAP